MISKSSCNFYSKIENEGELKINAELLNYSRGGVEAKANIIFNEKKVSDGLFKLFDPSLLESMNKNLPKNFDALFVKKNKINNYSLGLEIQN